MKGAILGFQRCWRWPKWAPLSSSWRMENSGKAIDSVSFTGWPDAGITSWEAPDGDGRTPAESHPRVRDGGAYRGGLALKSSCFQGFFGPSPAEKGPNEAQKQQGGYQPQGHHPGRLVE